MGRWDSGGQQGRFDPAGVREGEGRELLKRCPQLQSGLGETSANAARRRSPRPRGWPALVALLSSVPGWEQPLGGAASL